MVPRSKIFVEAELKASTALDGLRGFAVLGFPLHPPGKPSVARAEHLSRIRIPMLFIQGTRDTLADPTLLAPVLKKLGRKASAHMVDQADHAFHVPTRSGRNDGDVVTEIVDVFARWTMRITA